MAPEGYILVVEGEEELSGAVDDALTGCAVRRVVVSDFVSAKRRMISETPGLILCVLGIAGDAEGGYGFCSGLQEHSSFAQIPVLMFSPQITDEQIRRAAAAGAKGLMPCPPPAEGLRRRLAGLVPWVFEGAAASQGEESAAVEDIPLDPEMSRKVKFVELLLAKVLHDVKSSPLLRAAKRDEIPRLVFEMARRVCGIPRNGGGSAEQGKESEGVEP